MNEQPKIPENSEALNHLADQLEQLSKVKFPNGDRVMGKLITRLRAGDREMAKVFCINEFDKFSMYREDGVPVIIDVLFGGSGSPWSSVEAKLKKQKGI